MNQLTDKKKIRSMELLLMVTYMVSYLTRINYGAVIVEISRDTGISASLLSLAVTGSFFTYGIGQLFSGWIGDRVQPKRLVFCGLLVTICMNLLILLCKNPWQMTVVWCFNGLAQSMMWPPIVKLMTSLFSDEEYKKASVVVSWGSSFGTIFVYLTSPLWISIAGWKLVFVISAGLGMIMVGIWQKYCPNLTAEKAEQKEQGKVQKLLKNPMLWGIMLAIILQGALRDGVTTWMPTYVKDTFHFGSGISILTGVLLPIFSILCYRVTSAIYQKKPKEPVFCAGGIFLVGTAASALLLLVTGKNAVCSILMMALLTGCMHGVNLLLICMVPAFFKNSGNVASISGLLNFCTYVGSATSTYGIAKVSEQAGWNVTILIWMLVAAAGAAVCFLCVPAWKKFVGNKGC